MIDAATITEHMEVKGSDGHHVGRVDHIHADHIELAKMDLQAMGKHHSIPLSWIDHVDEHVHLSMTRDETKAQWETMN